MKVHKFIFAFLAFISIFVNITWFILEIIVLKNPRIVGLQAITSIFLAMLLPLLLSIFLFFKYQKIKRLFKISLTIILIFSIIASGFYSLIVTPFLEIISTTDNISDYLKTDVSNNIYSRIFPSEIPEKSINQTYYYAYKDNGPFHEDIYIIAKWDLPENEYITEKERILSQYPDGIFRINSESQMTDYFISYSDYLTLIFSFSDTDKTVQYIYENLTGHSQYIKKLYNYNIGDTNTFTYN